MAAKQRVKSKGSSAQEHGKAKAGRPSEAQVEVQRCWEVYWARRAELESAVVLVKDAHRALDDARRREEDLRQKFDEAKLTLKQLLDVEPSDASDDSSQASEKFN